MQFKWIRCWSLEEVALMYEQRKLNYLGRLETCGMATNSQDRHTQRTCKADKMSNSNDCCLGAGA